MERRARKNKNISVILLLALLIPTTAQAGIFNKNFSLNKKSICYNYRKTNEDCKMMKKANSELERELTLPIMLKTLHFLIFTKKMSLCSD